MFDWGSELFPDHRPLFSLPRGGGGRRRAKPKTDGQAGGDGDSQGSNADQREEPLPEAREEKSPEPKSTLKKAGWVEATTKFQTEASIFAEFEVPEAEKHRIQVFFQLVRLQDGKCLPHGSAQGRLNASGRAIARVPIHKDRADKETFRILAKHGTGEWSDGKGTDREVLESVEPEFDHDHVSGLHFPKNSSCIVPGYLKVFREMDKAFTKWKAKHPNGKIVIYGHAEPDEQSPHPHPLSVRRAQIAFAFLIGDFHTWGRIAREEKWGVWEQQHMLHAMEFYPDPPDGVPGPKTDKAILDFITWLNEAECKGINPMLGFTEEYVRLELYRVYIMGPERAVTMPSAKFRTVAGAPHVGCGAFNRYKGGDGHQGENRRVTFLFVSENANFPALFPCKSTPGPCEAEAAKAGERAVKGFRCGFYDGLMKEEKPAKSDLIGSLERADGKFERISFEGYQGQGCVLKDFRKYEGGAIQLLPERKILPSEPIPRGFKNECASLVQFFGIPHTSRWRRGPRVCDLEPGTIPVGTVVATLRDGKYHSDYSGRSHVGIYLSHDDYAEYLRSQDSTAGVVLFDQFNGQEIKAREYLYSADAEKEGRPAKVPWKDSEGNVQKNRVSWMKDGEEYFILLV